MQSYVIHFIRHGTTVEDNKGKYIGITNVPLSQKGIDDLKKYDSLYVYPHTPLLYTSPLLRCVQTCNVLYPNQRPIVLDGFSECSFGKWEGKSADELKNSPEFIHWLANSKDNRPPDGESGAEFTLRICRTFETLVNDLIRSRQTSAVVVTHAGVITTLLSVYGLPQAESYRWRMDNGFGYSVRITPLLWTRDKVIEVFGFCPKEKEND